MIRGNISHYKILEKLGEGGMGTVYKAEDIQLDRIVALKFLPTNVTSLPKKNRFINEAKALATLNHPNVASIYGIEEDGEKSFIVMEFVEGYDLRKLLTSEGSPKLTLEKILNIAIQIVQGLQAAHNKQIVHRDIKPENIIINAEEHVKILDFGLAKMKGKEQLTTIGTTIGTVAYMSPEQSRGEPVDHRTDIWSLGVILYEMISGSRPFMGDYEQAIIYSILNENPEPLKVNHLHIPEKMEKIVFKTLAKKPADRYNNCEELLNDLKSCLLAENQNEISIKELEENSFSIPKRNLYWYLNSIKKQLKISWRIILAIMILISISIYIFYPKLQNNNKYIKKIAVLPFVNMSNAPNDEYFSDGIMEDILTQLVKISDLKVISRTTMMKYKNTTKTLGEIAEELNTDVVLEGSVRRDSSRLRISVQLIDARTDEHIWAETYDKEFDQVFRIQSEIAQKIAVALNSKLSDVEKERFDKIIGTNSEAYNLFLIGRYFDRQGTKEDISKAIDRFKQALSIDSSDARIWCALATAYIRQADKGFLSTKEGYSKARWAAEKALSLDNNLAWGHAVMGLIKAFYDWDMIGAHTEFQKALALEPGNVIVIGNMANLSRALGRIDEAITLFTKLVDIEPINVSGYSNLGFSFEAANRLYEAETSYKKAIELNSQYPGIHTQLGLVYSLQRKTDAAINEIKLETDEGWRIYGLAIAYYEGRHLEEADKSLSELIAKYQDNSAFQIAEVYSFRGEIDLAFEWLEKAYILKDVGLTTMKCDPFLKNIETDPRYVNFLSKMNLPI